MAKIPKSPGEYDLVRTGEAPRDMACAIAVPINKISTLAPKVSFDVYRLIRYLI
ncbi:MAG: hypothetical protein PHJ00_06720 [Candidatus Omnitrophica bacterium]|nr:hypothetical protein [Candidatus Omnitrophota bacterium]